MSADHSSPLAIHGGTPVRTRPMPARKLFGAAELAAVTAVFERSWSTGIDFGYQGACEEKYTRAFCDFQGGGFADAVSSGTAAIFLAVQALDLPAGSDILISPVTDPGSVTPIIFSGHRVVIADAAPNSWNLDASMFAAALTPNTRAAVITHTAGIPAPMTDVLSIAAQHNIAVIEDCSQAHGAEYDGTKVGTFGSIAVFSTMFSKLHATGGCGGLVYTRDAARYQRVRALADRGKNFGDPQFAPREPATFLFPALNCNQDELSCAIGASTLARLPDILERRRTIAAQINTALSDTATVRPISIPAAARPAPFFHTVAVDTAALRVSKRIFAETIRAEGIDLNPDYRYVVADWPWLAPYLARPAATPNARTFRDRTFNILFNENYTDAEIHDIVAAIRKVEAVVTRYSRS